MPTLEPPAARPPAAQALPPLEAGDRLDQPTFMARYEAMPPRTRAELIGGIVYMPPPPVADGHNTPHGDLVYWLHHYSRFTPGVAGLNDARPSWATTASFSPMPASAS